MKLRLTDYTFTPASGTITFSRSVSLPGFLVITNVTRNEIIYNFAQNGQGGSLSGSTLTLDYNTTTHSSSDELMVLYEDTSVEPANTNLQDAIYELVARLDFLAGVRGVLSDLRVTPTGTVTISGATTVSSGTVTANVGTVGGYQSTLAPFNWQNQTAVLANINNVTV